ncbi:MAG: RusA family crossover junction endodeoxyribonuclease [Clostridia bacterium]
MTIAPDAGRTGDTVSDVVFSIPGEPKGKGRPRFSKPKGSQFVRTYTPDATVDYENRVKAMYAYGGFPKLEGPIRMTMVMYFGIPSSGISKKSRQYMIDREILPTKKVDLDNACKIVMDALNGVAFDDDKQIIELRAKKLYSELPRVVVKLHQYTILERIKNLFRIEKEK